VDGVCGGGGKSARHAVNLRTDKREYVLEKAAAASRRLDRHTSRKQRYKIFKVTKIVDIVTAIIDVATSKHLKFHLAIIF